MKKALSILLVLILSLCPISALAGNWYVEKAIILAERMHALAQDEAYVSIYLSGNEDVLMHITKLAEADFSAPAEARMLTLPGGDVSSAILQLYYSLSGSDVARLSETAEAEIYKRLPNLLISAINGSFGVSMVAASSVLASGETYIAPEDFQPGVLFLQYPGEYSLAVAFSQTGEDTITASATPVYTDFILNLTGSEDLTMLESLALNMLFQKIDLD